MLFLLPGQLHVECFSQLQQLSDAIECALRHLHALGIEMIEEVTSQLETWRRAIDPDDEESFGRHPVMHQPLMSDPIVLVAMQVLCSMVRSDRMERWQLHASVGCTKSKC